MAKFGKGARVALDIKGTELHGTVISLARGLATVELDDGRTSRPLDPAHLRPSNVPPPAARAWAKEDRVEFDNGPETMHGTVAMVRAGKAKVILDGGESSCQVPLRDLRASTKVLPAPVPSVMDRWGVTKYQANKAATEETEAFTAVLTLDGVPAIAASNRGTGGCNSYHMVAGAAPGTLKAFHDDALAWGREVGEDFEPSDSWLTWSAHYKPYAVTAKEYAAALRAAIDGDPDLPAAGPR